ncbi:hypothetical protein COHA_007038 [Chlorella ohadii]|uniref:Uncharacterized protein n=1 Tax=Chlorella ohadii TaxID=2649997 RepID=A0AAD5H3U7_9CHLO|nr:hypothetical protein COHA_007038 [Chlorella ohadii]
MQGHSRHMCVTYFAWLHPQLPDILLLLLFNRDEVLDRPTRASHWWQDLPHILGGRDLQAGGTWMALSTTGRAAFLTNFRQLRYAGRQGAPSRGALPVNFVTGQAAPEEYLAGIDAQAYPGFNLMAADLQGRRMAYLCSKQGDQGPQLVSPGLHGVTNGVLEAHWPKASAVDEGRRRLQQLLDRGAFNGARCSPDSSGGCGGGSGRSAGADGGSASGSGDGSDCDLSPGAAGGEGSGGRGGGAAAVPWAELFQLLSDDRRLEEDPARLPDTGYGHEFEAAVSGIFVQPVDTQWGAFGTRSQTVVAVWADGRGELRERYIGEGGSWQEQQHCFEIPSLQADAKGAAAGKGGGGGDGDNDGSKKQQSVNATS